MKLYVAPRKLTCSFVEYELVRETAKFYIVMDHGFERRINKSKNCFRTKEEAKEWFETEKTAQIEKLESQLQELKDLTPTVYVQRADEFSIDGDFEF